MSRNCETETREHCKPARNAPRLEGGKRLNLVQARLNDGEREQFDRMKARLGMTDSGVIRAALARLERGFNGQALFGQRDA